eukprot:GILI01003417.1.p1 GENE.GILI01003417.1~~GILI01003417.1.p1  ORF type:complete len:906 (+),score=340.73 GILI01003417.1:67-2784(+)
MGVKSQKKAKTRLDAYYRLAKDQGYRARSAFKLIQLNRKYDFLSKARVLVDLCAAPGGWCQVAAKYMPIGSKIVGVDLVPIVPIRGCKTFVGDITDDKTRKMIVTWLKKEPVDAVIHDGAPNVGGVWARDLFDQNALVLCATKMATTLLRPGGWFVTKVFRSQDFQKLMWVFKQLFDKVEATKPLASRMESAEIFVVCAGYKAPKHIDPKMFNAQSVFSDVGAERVLNAAGAFVTPRTNVPMGYDEFSTIAHRVGTMSDFISCQDPKDFLKSHHEIRFPDEDKHYLQSKHSRKELIYLCHDLQQVGEADRRRLMRWRDQLVREQTRILKAEQDNVEEDEEDEEEEEGELDPNADVRTMALKLLEIQKRKDKEEKKKGKRVVDRKLRQVRGLMNHDPLGNARDSHEIGGFATQTGGEGEEDGVNHTEYALSALNNISEAEVAAYFDKHHEDGETSAIAPIEPIISVNVDDDEDYDMGKGEGETDADTDDEEEGDYTHVGKSLRLVEGEEHQYDVDNYGNYVMAEKSNRVSIFDKADQHEADEDDGLTPAERKVAVRKERDDEKLKEAGNQSKWQRRAVNIDQVLNRTFPKPRDPNSVRRQQKKEEDVIEMKGVAADKSAALLVGERRNNKVGVKRTRYDDKDDEESNDDAESDDTNSVSDISDDYYKEGEETDYDINEGRGVDTRRKKAIVQDLGKLTTMELIKQQRKQVMKDNKAKTKTKKGKKENKENKGFEEIPVAMTDPEVRARTLAIATKMLDGKSRRQILDNSVNKYMHNDDDDLPDWFIKDEQRNCKVILPITAAEMDAERNRFLVMNARPSKKVAEAMGRKRRKAQRMLRGMIEKGKSDPRAREKANKTSVRTLMRSTSIKGDPGKKKKDGPMDSKKFGELKRAKQRMKRDNKGKRRK